MRSHYELKWPHNKDHLSSKATIFGSQGWSLYTDLTELSVFFNYSEMISTGCSPHTSFLNKLSEPSFSLATTAAFTLTFPSGEDQSIVLLIFQRLPFFPGAFSFTKEEPQVFSRLGMKIKWKALCHIQSPCVYNTIRCVSYILFKHKST